ncbi:hypothetical protein WN943_016783 [Citrus x changshan-huyou]
MILIHEERTTLTLIIPSGDRWAKIEIRRSSWTLDLFDDDIGVGVALFDGDANDAGGVYCTCRDFSVHSNSLPEDGGSLLCFPS